MAEQLGEPLETRIPEFLIAAEPVVGALERPRVDAAVVNAATDGALHQTRALERLDVLGGGSERHPVWGSQLADRSLPFGEGLEHRPAGVVTERTENHVQLGFRLFNHGVEYMWYPPIVNRMVE